MGCMVLGSLHQMLCPTNPPVLSSQYLIGHTYNQKSSERNKYGLVWGQVEQQSDLCEYWLYFCWS